MRKAGCAIFGIIAEGCCDAIKPLLSQILPKLLSSMSDGDYYVRECACFALGELPKALSCSLLFCLCAFVG